MTFIKTHTPKFSAALPSTGHLYSYLILNRLYGLKTTDIERLIQHDDLASLLSSSQSNLKRAGFSEELIQQIKTINLGNVEAELAWAEKPNHYIITLADPAYPDLLRAINAPPLVLFVHGDPSCLKLPQLAIVGSRNPTSLGQEIAHQFAHYLAEQGIIITSGLAVGVDAASHRGALLSGRTIAVLGTSIDSIYPARHAELAEKIAENGAVVSEFPLTTSPEKKNFPRRNRIISGLSVGTLVVEAALGSGSLITAKYAGEQGREVFAIPGSIHNPLAHGCHKLIRDGAKLVEKAQDILEELNALLNIAELKKKPITKAKTTGFVSETDGINENRKAEIATKFSNGSQENLDEGAKKLLSSIGFEVTAVDTLVARTGFSPRIISSMLLLLELEGYVKQVPGGYVRAQGSGIRVQGLSS